ncbi:trypsin-like peptidase domain-containing protein [Variovorax sp. RA8]|uniref:trypsin-like peptidase domain-containing protein n=1 Tax=Variovorax sp. (strain JCM 16519 / RA8) TaxID=662548 RepID=UPI003FCEC335
MKIFIIIAMSAAAAVSADAAELNAALRAASDATVSISAGAAASFQGVIVGPRQIATVCHRLAGANSYSVSYSQGTTLASLVAADEDRNVCLLQTAGALPEPVATSGSTSSIRQGARVTALDRRGMEVWASDLFVSACSTTPAPCSPTSWDAVPTWPTSAAIFPQACA